MEGGRGRFCDFDDEDSSVGRGHDRFDDFDFDFELEVCLKELSSLSSVIGSSNRDTPGQQNWPILIWW